MIVALTGATGFIGRHVLDALAACDLDLAVMVRPGRPPPALPPRARSVVMDLDDASPDTFDQLGRPDVLIHLAWGGLPHYSSDTHLDIELPRQRRFLDACMQGGLRRLLVTGTCLEYGMQEGELGEHRPAAPTTAYALAKQRLHEELDAERGTRGLALAWLRVFYLFGPGQAASSLYSQLNAAIERGDGRFPMSPGDQVRDFMHVKQAAANIVQLALLPVDAGIVNLCSGQPTRVVDIARRWVAERGSPITLETGRFPYPSYEPFSFWGSRSRLDQLLEAK
jgi:dTDP-6-deoxy-L-talose 4-dehydrogenase (NAD+)